MLARGRSRQNKEVNKMAEKNPFFRRIDEALNRYRESTGKEPEQIILSVRTFRLLCREADPFMTKDDADGICPLGNFYCGIPIRIDLRQEDDCITVGPDDSWEWLKGIRCVKEGNKCHLLINLEE